MAAQNVQDMPLRRVVSITRPYEGYPVETYECGHKAHPRVQIGGFTKAMRRRCWQCLSEQEIER